MSSTNDASEVIGQPDRRAAGLVDGQTEHALRVHVCTSWSELDAYSGSWERLLGSTPSASIFVTREWLGAWWRSFAPAARLRALLFFDAAGELVGLAPFYQDVLEGALRQHLRRLRLVGDGSHDSDNLDFIARPGYEQSCAQAFLSWFERQSGCDIGELNTLASDSPMATWLLRGFKQRGWTHALHTRPRLVVVLPQSWNAYLRRLSNNDRWKLRSHKRRLESTYQLRLRKCTDPARLSGDLYLLFQLHQKRWTERGASGSFSSPARRQFYEEMARLFLARGWLEFWLLELDGRAAAAQFAFRYRETAYSLQEGFDPGHSKERVGLILRAHVLQQLIADGLRRYDFLAGVVDPAKGRWRPETWSYVDIHFARPLSRGSLYLRLVQSGASAKEWMRANLPRSHFAIARAAYRRLRGEILAR